MRVTEIFSPALAQVGLSPYFAIRIPAGAPSHMEEPLQSTINILDYLIRHTESTFFITVEGDSMEPEIRDGDLLVVDRTECAYEGDTVVAYIDGDFTVKIYSERHGKLWLVPTNPLYQARQVKESNGFEVWGVVTSVIHKLK